MRAETFVVLLSLLKKRYDHFKKTESKSAEITTKWLENTQMAFLMSDIT